MALSLNIYALKVCKYFYKLRYSVKEIIIILFLPVLFLKNQFIFIRAKADYLVDYNILWKKHKYIFLSFSISYQNLRVAKGIHTLSNLLHIIVNYFLHFIVRKLGIMEVK